MTNIDREQLRRDLSDALERQLKEQRLDGLTPLADTVRTLSPTYRMHGEQMEAAAWAREENTVTWHLIHTLEKLEKGLP